MPRPATGPGRAATRQRWRAGPRWLEAVSFPRCIARTKRETRPYPVGGGSCLVPAPRRSCRAPAATATRTTTRPGRQLRGARPPKPRRESPAYWSFVSWCEVPGAKAAPDKTPPTPAPRIDPSVATTLASGTLGTGPGYQPRASPAAPARAPPTWRTPHPVAPRPAPGCLRAAPAAPSGAFRTRCSRLLVIDRVIVAVRPSGRRFDDFAINDTPLKCLRSLA
jgi:hypothetical protein